MTRSLYLECDIRSRSPLPVVIAMGFVDEQCNRTCFGPFHLDVKSQLFLFPGPRNGHTRGVLSVSTSATLAHRPFTWFILTLVLFLFPSLLLASTLSYDPAVLAFECDPQSSGVAISLISVYWGLTLLVLGSRFSNTEYAGAYMGYRANHSPWMVCF